MGPLFSNIYYGICKEQNDLKLREIKCKKMGDCTFKAIYFILVSGWGYYVLKDEYYMPPYLGGSGDYYRGME